MKRDIKKKHAAEKNVFFLNLIWLKSKHSPPDPVLQWQHNRKREEKERKKDLKMGIQADQHKLLWSERKEMSGHVHIYFPSITFTQNTHTQTK